MAPSKVWRIEPGTLEADCATSPACSVVADGFTSIIDLATGLPIPSAVAVDKGGMLYAVINALGGVQVILLP